MTDEMRLSSIEHQLNSHDQRLQALEKMASTTTTDSAVRKLRDEHMDKRFDTVEENIKDLKGYLLKIVWIIVSSILLAFVGFVIQGGLAGGL